MSRQLPADMSVYSIGGTDLLGVFRNVRYAISPELAEARSIKQFGDSPRRTKLGATVQTGIMKNVSAERRYTNLDVSSLTIGGTAYSTMLRGGNISGSFRTTETSAVMDLFKFPLHVSKSYRISLELMIPLSATANPVTGFAAAIHSATASQSEVVWSLGLLGLTLTLPTVIAEATHEWSDDSIAMYSLELEGQSPAPGTGYPTSPVGTTTLAEKAIVTPNSPVAFSLTSIATASQGVNYAGNLIPGSFQVGFNDSEITMQEYNYISQGTITVTPT